MKKNYLMGLATLTMIMAGCSQNEVLNSEMNGESNVIGFSTYTGKTKTAEPGTNANLPGGFGVAAFLDAGTTPYMGTANAGAQISWKTNKWDYQTDTDIRYWPATGTLKFYAYAPFANTNRNNVAPTYSSTEGMKFTGYVVPEDFTKQEDFMYASQLSPNSGSAVALAFNHALTQVLFTVTAIGSLKVDINTNGIEICNVMSKGTFSLTTDAKTASWATTTDKVTYKLTSPAVADIISTTTTATAIGDKGLMLMPQALTKWNTTATIAANDTDPSAPKNTYLKISCKIFDTAANAYRLGSADTYGTTYVPFAATWTMNKKITYNLKFGGGFDKDGKPILNPITFTPTVEDWETVTPSTDLPLN